MVNLPSNFVETANERFQTAKRFLNNWRGTARDDFAFIAGKQWTAEDTNKLQEEKRPVVTFNYSEKMIDAVVGAEVSNRQEVTYRPRETQDAALAEVWNNAAKWVRDQCNAEDEESDSFRDALICGLGWTQTHMSYDDDLDGRVLVDRVDPLEMSYDPAARKPGLSDRRYNFREWWVDKKDAKREWPKTYDFASEDMNSGNRSVTRTGQGYNDEENETYDTHKDQVQIRHYECYELERVYRIANPNGLQELTQSEYSSVKQALKDAGTEVISQFKKVYYRAYFAGETLLEGGLSPSQKGFTFQAITAKRDRNQNYWYGLTKVMKDPQRWANKWLSQILHIINSNAKGGLMAESGAFVDPKKAQDEWAMPESITLLTEGGITKIKEKTMTSFPAGLDRLMEFALSSLPMVTGINLEALGLANREQASILETQRKQAAYGLLAPLFDSLRRYRKTQGRVMLDFMNKFISDGRMIRIGGVESQQFLPLTKVEGAQEYDVFVDQSPNAPDVKDKTWQTLTQLLPAMMKAGIPLPPDLLDYAPLPVALAQKWKAFIDQQKQQQQGPSPEQVQEMQKQMQKLQEENQKLQQQVSSKQGELQIQQQELQMELQMKQQALQQEFALKQAALQEEIRLKQENQVAEIALAQSKARGDLAIKSAVAEANADIAAKKADNNSNSSQ